MHRFRKKSNPAPPTFHVQVGSPQPPSLPNALPELPAASDFRTSLILPDLSRRFSVLRSSSGEPVSVDVLRYKLAEQRARGAEHQVTEEEEEMIFESLGFRNRAATPSKSQESVAEAGSGPSSSASTARSNKRYSNNLFGSGKFRDQTYIRNASSKAGSTRSRAQSSASTSTDITTNIPPADTPPSTSFYSEHLSVRSAPLAAPAPYGDQSQSQQPDMALSKTLSNSAYKRASLALEQAINELAEDEEGPDEDEVLLPRSAPIMRSSIDQRRSPDPVSVRSINPRSFEASGMAISSDKHVRAEYDDRRASPVPSKTLPGYIPGMPRPMTPREMDADEQRSYSTTPRATSPSAPSRIESPFTTSVMSSFMRPDSASPPASVRQSPVPMVPYPNTTPLFLQRSPNGRHTPDDSRIMSEIAIDFDQSLNSSILGRRRAASPLSSGGGSRPGTPSSSSAAMAWPQPPASPPRHHGHNRNGSWFSDSSEAGSNDLSNGKGMRSLKSPPLPDSPVMERGHNTFDSISSQYSFPERRPISPMSPMDLGTAAIPTNRAVRSATPTHEPTSLSPTAASFHNGDSPRSMRSSKNHASAQFNFDSLQRLVFSPLANSSRSSLESTGSSYHSWEGDRREGIASLFSESDPKQPAWHDIEASDQASSITPGPSLDDDAEAIIQSAGLKMSDFLAIQEKLVQVASTKFTPPETPPARAPSLRRRRPSTSQSTYSFSGRITSTPTSPQNGVFTTPPPLDANQREVNESDDSSPTRKNRALAGVLFGPPDDPLPTEHEEAEKKNFSSFSFPDEPMSSPPPPPMTPTDGLGPYTPSRNPSMPRLPMSPQEEELTREVGRRANEAILALKGASQSNLNVSSHSSHAPSSTRKRISPNQISTPTLVSASTSVDTIPLRSQPIPIPAQQSGPTKISRFKKLRGTLRKPNNLPTGEEVTPFPLDVHSQSARHNLGPLNVPTSATEPRFKVTVPSPPNSAGPGLKGFMARFRSKPRTIDPSLQYVSRQSPQPGATSPLSPLSPGYPQNGPGPGHASKVPSSSQAKLNPSSPSSPIFQTQGESKYSGSLNSPTTPRAVNHILPGSDSGSSTPIADESMALQQLFHAAHDLGIDEKRLKDLVLVRSASTSSKATGLGRNSSTTLSRNHSTVSALSRNTSVTLAAASNLKRNNSAVVSNQLEGHAEAVAGPSSGNGDHHVVPDSGSRSQRKPIPDHIRRPREGVDPANHNSAVVRRTIIVPSEFRKSAVFDINALVGRAPSQSHHRKGSATSSSVRSVQDRVPTPPPPRNGSRRVSRDGFPPVPQLPSSSAAGPSDPRLKAPGLEPSNSNYDSLFDMYTGDAKTQPGSSQGGHVDHNQVLEVLELANGETIWSIVNGLRDEDTESLYDGRASSEYEVDDEMQVYVKEHQRSDSGASSNYKQRPQQGARPETKVFYSSSAHIGRLIENLSQGMEAGSFNFNRNNLPAQSTTSSMTVSDTDGTWTVEERLDHMLGKMGGGS